MFDHPFRLNILKWVISLKSNSHYEHTMKCYFINIQTFTDFTCEEFTSKVINRKNTLSLSTEDFYFDFNPLKCLWELVTDNIFETFVKHNLIWSFWKETPHRRQIKTCLITEHISYVSVNVGILNIKDIKWINDDELNHHHNHCRDSNWPKLKRQTESSSLSHLKEQSNILLTDRVRCFWWLTVSSLWVQYSGRYSFAKRL